MLQQEHGHGAEGKAAAPAVGGQADQATGVGRHRVGQRRADLVALHDVPDGGVVRPGDAVEVADGGLGLLRGVAGHDLDEFGQAAEPRREPRRHGERPLGERRAVERNQHVADLDGAGQEAQRLGPSPVEAAMSSVVEPTMSTMLRSPGCGLSDQGPSPRDVRHLPAGVACVTMGMKRGMR